MKKNHFLLIAGFAFCGLTASSCTKENTQPQSNTKKTNTVNPANNTSQTASSPTLSTPPPPPSESTASGGCSHPH
jgi:hypothetical protein